MKRRGPRNFSKFGGFFLVLASAGIEMGSRGITITFFNKIFSNQ